MNTNTSPTYMIVFSIGRNTLNIFMLQRTHTHKKKPSNYNHEWLTRKKNSGRWLPQNLGLIQKMEIDKISANTCFTWGIINKQKGKSYNADGKQGLLKHDLEYGGEWWDYFL